LDEFITGAQPQAGAQAPETEFYLATVYSWSNAEGVRFTLDGETQPTSKSYKMMLMCRPLSVGMRVVVMKQSGTYIVLGEINKPNSWKKIDDLASGATTAQIVSTVNDLLGWLRTQGMLRT